MSCITKLLELKGDKKFISSPLQPNIIIEGGGTYKGFEYIVVLNNMAFRCGYVAIPKTHPAYPTEDYNGLDIDVHGGVTFFDEPHLIESECGDKWAGFDAGHCNDGHDLKAHKEYFGEDDETNKYMCSRDYYKNQDSDRIRTFEYMESECKKMIDQLVA
jgi:hypothetical protein